MWKRGEQNKDLDKKREPVKGRKEKKNSNSKNVNRRHEEVKIVENNRWKKDEDDGNDRNRNDRNRNDRNRNDRNRRNDRNMYEDNRYYNMRVPEPVVVKTNFVNPLYTEDVLNELSKLEPIEGKYANIAKGEEEPEDKPLVDMKNPSYWKGSTWVGPVFLRSKKQRGPLNPGASTLVFNNTNAEYSRDGRRWYNSYDATFTQSELYAKRVEREEEMAKSYANALEERYLKRKEESHQYYLETGLEDSFAWVEREEREFEERMALLDDAMKYDEEDDMFNNEDIEYDSDNLSD